MATTERPPSTPEPGGEDPKRVVPDWAVVLLLVESSALLIALLMPVTPSKTGSTWTPAQLFWADPSYLEEVSVYFLMVHLLIFVIGLVAWAAWRFGRSGSE